MEYILIVFGLIFVLAGLVGSIAPIIPGPPLAYFSLVALELAQDGRLFSNSFFIVLAIITAIVTIGENILPILGAKVSGASRQGVWGAAIGLLAGAFFFPPLGLILGVLLGAIIGEILAGKKRQQALRAGLATFLGNLMSMLVKLILSIIIAFYFFTGLWQSW